MPPTGVWGMQRPCSLHDDHPAQSRVVTAVTRCQWRHPLQDTIKITVKCFKITKAKTPACALCAVEKLVGSLMHAQAKKTRHAPTRTWMSCHLGWAVPRLL